MSEYWKDVEKQSLLNERLAKYKGGDVLMLTWVNNIDPDAKEQIIKHVVGVVELGENKRLVVLNWCESEEAMRRLSSNPLTQSINSWMRSMRADIGNYLLLDRKSRPKLRKLSEAEAMLYQV